MHGLNRIVHAQVLVIARHQLDQPAFGFGEQDEILDDVQQAGRLARAANHRVQADDARLAFAVDALPVGKMLPLGGEAAHQAVAAVREDDEGVVPKELGNGVFVIAQVVVVGVLEFLVRGFEFDKHERQAVDESHQVGPPLVHLARDPELRGEKEIVVGGRVPINHADGFGWISPSPVPSTAGYPLRREGG